MRELWIRDTVPMEIAVMEDGRLAEYLRDREDDAGAETIYLGRVERIVPGMQAAFVNIGQERNGFLPLKEKSESFPPLPLQTGNTVLVQIKRAAHDQKGAFLSRDITLCGTYVILMPMNRYIGVSAKIQDHGGMKRLGQEIAGDRFGLILRTAAEQAAPEAVQQEAEALYQSWQNIRQQAATAHVPSVIYEPEGILQAAIRDYKARGGQILRTDTPALAEKLKAMDRVELAEPGFMQEAIRQRNKALERFVWLKSGGSLVIDACEAMTVIDVNTGKYTGKHQLAETVRKTNLEAAREAARQIRLRNVGGIVIIDFIDMEQEEDRRQVIRTIEEEALKDRSKVVVHGFTSLGLLELTRKRSGLPLRDEWTEKCTACRGNGRCVPEEENG